MAASLNSLVMHTPARDSKREVQTVRKFGTRNTWKRIGLIASISTIPLALASPAWAVVSYSYIQGGVAGFTSHSLTDDGGTGGNKVDFTGCHTYSGSSVTVQLRREVIGPDTGYDEKTYTACFNGGTSSGEWGAGVEGHDYYFRITEIDGSSIVGPTINVDQTRMSF